MKSVSRRACSRLPGCPAYSCSDDNCLGRKVTTHEPASRSEGATAELHRHKWYYQKRWGHIRLGQLSREPLCQRCKSYGFVTAAEHVDHVQAHKGSAELFFDAGNLQSLCRSCHSWKTTAEQKGVDFSELDWRS